MTSMISKLGRAAVFVILVVVAGGLAVWWWFDRELDKPFRGFTAESVTFEIPRGSSGRSILAELQRLGVIRDARLARWVHRYRLGDAPLKAGEYRFDGPQTVEQALTRLIRGEVVAYPVTVPEGWDLEETAAHLAAGGFGRRDALLSAMRDPSAIRDLDPRASTLEGYLFPDTYSFAKGTSESEIVATMVRGFRSRYTAEVAPLRPWPAELPDLRALVALASLVEKESSAAVERPLVAGVYTRRLRIGMLLQADPTVIYARKLRQNWNGNLTRADLQLDDPYNTYRFPGLPPGPICSPGLASLVAAARPQDEGYLYFVSRNDGTHVFASTLSEHNANVLEWQKRYWSRRWGARAGPSGPAE